MFTHSKKLQERKESPLNQIKNAHKELRKAMTLQEQQFKHYHYFHNYHHHCVQIITT